MRFDGDEAPKINAPKSFVANAPVAKLKLPAKVPLCGGDQTAFVLKISCVGALHWYVDVLTTPCTSPTGNPQREARQRPPSSAGHAV